MTWQYRLSKQTVADKVRYKLVEAYLNDEGEVWGYTGHLDVLNHLQHDNYDDDEQVRDDVLTVLFSVMSDIELPIIDEDNFIGASTGFEEELEAIRSDN